MPSASDIQDRFIAKANEVHNNRYTYENTTYVDLATDINVTCKLHGIFKTKPRNHYLGYGCPDCLADEKRLANENMLIAKAKTIHGDKFDYTQMGFINTRTKINIICKKHGVQNMYYATHINGTGCPKCSQEKHSETKLKTLDYFITKANIVHGNKYSYEKSIYQGTGTNLIITCPTHGDFEQLPSNHLSGSICPKCNIENRIKYTQDNIVSVFQEIHGDRYDYSQVNYIDLYTNITIICNEHGSFEQTPASHIYQKAGCVKCGLNRTRESKMVSLEEFISNSNNIHNNKYDYTLTKLGETLKDKVWITCPEHGEFEQSAVVHTRGSGCNACGYLMNNDHVRWTNKQFITAAKEVHGDRYDYSQVNYRSRNDRVDIYCKQHERMFSIYPGSHLSGSGCIECTSTNGERRVMYYLEDNHISYKNEYSIPGSRYRYDFYLPDLNILIEYDGGHHFKPVKAWGGMPLFLKIKKSDKAKNELAVAHGIHLIRIPYTKFNELPRYLTYKISKLYKYKVDKKYYMNFLELCKGLQLPGDTKPKDVKQYLIYT